MTTDNGRVGNADWAGHEPSRKRLGHSVTIPRADGSNWTAKTVDVWNVYYCGDYVAYKVSFYGDWHLKDREGVVFSASSLEDVMAHAQAIEAQRAETAHTGSVHEGLREVKYYCRHGVHWQTTCWDCLKSTEDDPLRDHLIHSRSSSGEA